MKHGLRVTLIVSVCLGLFAGLAVAQEAVAVKPQPTAVAATHPAATSQPAAAPGQPVGKGAMPPGATKGEGDKPKDDKVSVSFKGMSIEKIGKFLAEKVHKPVIPDESIKNKKITVICDQKKSLKEALSLIQAALLTQGIMIEEQESLIRIRPVSDILKARWQQIPAGKSVTKIENKTQIVAKEFIVQHYDVMKLVTVLKPMLPSYGHIMADPDSRRIVVTDTVGNLARIEQVVKNMDVALHDQTITEIIKLEHGDAAEIIAIVKWLISGLGMNAKDITTSGAAWLTWTKP